MLSALLLATTASLAPTDAQVVFAARFYYPAGDKRISRYQVYVSRLDGSRRRQLSRSKCDVWLVQWLGPDRLVWLEGSRDLKIYDMRLRKVVRSIQANDDPASYYAHARGDGRLWNDSVLLPEGRFRKRERERGANLFDDHWKVRLPSGQTIESAKEKQATSNGFRYTIEGASRSVRLGGMPSELYVGKDRKVYLEAFEGGGSVGSAEMLYEFDPKTAATRLIVDDIGGLDFDPSSNYWSGIEAWRPLVPLGKKKVWANKVYVGNRITGKRWAIADGIVHGTSVQIRPGL